MADEGVWETVASGTESREVLDRKEGATQDGAPPLFESPCYRYRVKLRSGKEDERALRGECDCNVLGLELLQ